MTTKILDKRSSPRGVEYRCELEPLWLPADLVKEVQIGCVHVRSYEKGLVRAARLNTLGNTKEEAFRCNYVEQVTSSRCSAPIEALADLVIEYDESGRIPFHVQRLNPPQASSRASQPILDEGAVGCRAKAKSGRHKGIGYGRAAHGTVSQVFL
jgi:hypothetical protein